MQPEQQSCGVYDEIRDNLHPTAAGSPGWADDPQDADEIMIPAREHPEEEEAA